MLQRQFRILLVDDDDLDALQIERGLERSGLRHELHRAQNGEVALQWLQNNFGGSGHRPHFILLDLKMPRMDGLEFLRELRSDPVLQSLTVFMLTSSSEEADRRRAFSYHVAGYLLKPVSFDNFHHTLEGLRQFVEVCEFPR